MHSCRRHHWNCSPAVLIAAGLLLAGQSTRGDSVTNRFGFTGPEIFPVDDGIAHLRSGDFDGDGLQDLLVVNNSRSRISLLFNTTGQTNRTGQPKPGKFEINELPADARFRIDSIASEKRISSITVTDLNGDEQLDVAYFGEPKELVVQYNQGTNGWSTPKRWPLTDGLLNPNALIHGDINGDERDDLFLMAEGHVYWLAQGENGFLSEPRKIPYSGTVKALQVLDIDGDGRDDLLLVDWASPNPFRFRLQTENGQIGPEIHFELPPIRSYWADDLDRDLKTEVITIAQNSGRAQVSHFTQDEASPLSGDWKQGQVEVLPLNKTTKAKRGSLWADLNQDQQPDLLVAEPDSGQITLYLQIPGGSLSASKTFATLTGVSDLAVADWDDDGKPEIFLLSQDERQIGVSRLDDNGRIAFPDMLLLEGRPLAMAVGRLREGGPGVLAVAIDLDGKRELQIWTADGRSHRQALAETFKSNPNSISFHDADQDGLNDLVVLIPYEKIKILRQREGQDYEEADVAPPGGIIDQPWLSAADVDGDGKRELLLAQKNFLRAVVLRQEEQPGLASRSTWRFEVKEQINGAGGNSRIVGASALRNGTNQIASVFLLDAERKVLTLCERDADGVWEVVRNLPLPVSGFDALDVIGVGQSQPNAIALLGVNAVAWLKLEGKVWAFTELDGYETLVRDGHLTDVVSGDLNQDGRKDLVFLETAKSYLDVVAYEPPHRLVPANRWQVFEERTFRSRRSERPEPREALIVDLTEDGKNDLAVIVHDRILVYPQE